ncbi:MAG: signal peptidase I [Porticoccaceae bacterium]
MPNKWFAAILGFLFQPLAFLYLAKLKLAIVYFSLLMIVGIADFALIKKTGYSGLGLLLAVVCSVHAFRKSKTITFEDGRKWYSHWWGALSIPLIFIVAVFLFRSFFYEPFRMPASSMLPTLNVGDHIVVSKWSYGLYGSYGIELHRSDTEARKKPNRGEIFIFYPPHDERVFIKRIIGLPGDIIEFSDKQLVINGVAVKTAETESPAVYTEVVEGNSYSVQYLNDNSSLRIFNVTVPEKSYFVMGDNRDNSADSRVWGMVPAENVIGKLILIW